MSDEIEELEIEAMTEMFGEDYKTQEVTHIPFALMYAFGNDEITKDQFFFRAGFFTGWYRKEHPDG